MAKSTSKPSLRTSCVGPSRVFYFVEGDYKINIGIRTINDSDILLGGQVAFVANPRRRGFPDLSGRPIFQCINRKSRLRRDFEPYAGWWITSDRLKAVLESVDIQACSFLNCDLQSTDGLSVSSIWLCDIIRTIDAFDETASDIDIAYRDDGRKRYDRIGRSITLRQDIDPDAHIFRPVFASSYAICDNIFKKECSDKNISGIRFIQI